MGSSFVAGSSQNKPDVDKLPNTRRNKVLKDVTIQSVIASYNSRASEKCYAHQENSNKLFIFKSSCYLFSAVDTLRVHLRNGGSMQRENVQANIL